MASARPPVKRKARGASDTVLLSRPDPSNTPGHQGKRIWELRWTERLRFRRNRRDYRVYFYIGRKCVCPAKLPLLADAKCVCPECNYFKIADNAGMLYHGKIIEKGTPGALSSPESAIAAGDDRLVMYP